jgi:hypothetical protein
MKSVVTNTMFAQNVLQNNCNDDNKTAKQQQQQQQQQQQKTVSGYRFRDPGSIPGASRFSKK